MIRSLAFVAILLAAVVGAMVGAVVPAVLPHAATITAVIATANVKRAPGGARRPELAMLDPSLFWDCWR